MAEEPEAPTIGTNFIAPFNLTREEETDLHDRIRSKLPELISWTSDPPGTEWKRVKSLGTAIYEFSTQAEYRVRSTATIKASATKLLNALDSGVVSNYRNVLRQIYQHTFAETSVLHHTKISDHESLAIQWSAYRCHNPLLTDIDFCCVEYTNLCGENAVPLDNQEDASCDSTQRLGYKLCQSYTTKYCPNLIDSHRLERMTTPMYGFVFYPTDCHEVTKVTFTIAINQDISSPLRRHANRRLALFLAAALPRLYQAVEGRQNHLPLELKIPIDDSAIACHECARLFTHLRRRHSCRACGNAICRECSKNEDFALPSVGLTRIRLCSSCYATAKPQPTLSPAPVPPVIQNRARRSLPSRAPRLNLDLDLVQTTSPSSPSWMNLSPLTKQRFFKKGAHPNFATRHPPASPTLPSPSKKILMPQIDSPMKPLPVSTLLSVCERAAEALCCKFVGLTISKQPGDPVYQHFLHAKGSGKLLPVPAQLAINHPILTTREVLIVGNIRNEWPTKQQVEWNKLPIVIGPQKAQFYAGTPIHGHQDQLWGALCAFDPTPRDTKATESEMRKTLATLASSVVTTLESKRLHFSQRRKNDVSDGREECPSPLGSPSCRKTSLRGGRSQPQLLTNQDGLLA